MHFARVFEALRARPAVVVAAGLVLVCLFGFASALSPRRPASSNLLFTNSAPPTVTTLDRTPVPVVTFAPKPPPAPALRAATNAPPIIVVKANRPLAPLTLRAEPTLPLNVVAVVTNCALSPLRLHADRVILQDTVIARTNRPLVPLSLHANLPSSPEVVTPKTTRPLVPLSLHANLPSSPEVIPPQTTRPLVPLSLHADLAPPVAPGIAMTNRPLAALAIHANLPPDTNPPPLGIYAPSGRLLRCQLVNTVDSADIDTPVIALVTHDLWHDGQLVVPAGTEVHSRARLAQLRDRIVASGLWTLVWQSGEELTVRGIALDREEDASGQTWAITDGSAGLHGEVQNSQATKKVELFLATFLSGMASGLQQTRETIFGTQVASTVPNAALNGTSQVLNSYAQQILDTIKRDGVFVRVPAGKEMYLYLTETLDRSQARIGNLRVAKHQAPVTFSSSNPGNKPGNLQ